MDPQYVADLDLLELSKAPHKGRTAGAYDKLNNDSVNVSG